MNQDNDTPTDHGFNNDDADLDALRGVRAGVASASAPARARAQAPWADCVPVVEMSRRHSKRGRSFAARTSIALVTTAALIAGIFAIQQRRIDDVKPANTVSIPPSVASIGNEATAKTFLLIGSDSREFVDSGSLSVENGGGRRSDTIALVRLDPKNDSVHLVSVPRDLWVAIPGHGENKINAAYTFGGPALVVETIASNLHVTIDHVLETNFVQFQRLVDELDGIKIAFGAPTRDRFTGLDQQPGCHTLNGNSALQFVRSRHTEFFEDGKWKTDPRADFGRIARQHIALRQLGAAAIDQIGLDPVPMLNTLFHHLVVDSRFTVRDALRLFTALRDSANVTTEILSVEPSNSIGGVSALTEGADTLDQIGGFLRGSASAKRDPNDDVLAGVPPIAAC